MPLGFQRLNERTQRPNANINFIKPLEGPDVGISKDFLDRIAAQCYPIMKEHYVSVMSLEEHAPNAEFLGRNFNAGEVIQLVLKDRSGRWLSFKFVQMVMMHELAHCKQMNHSRAFWNVRNGYAKEMEGLWAKRYVGEGMFGRGKGLATGAFVHEQMPSDAQIPERLCGGTYRRARGGKRKRGQDAAAAADDRPKVSYAERQQKRIAKKFGKHGDGNALGDDELVRGALDSKSGKRHAGKPKVAGSKRGRDLRANAALARFEQAKKQTLPESTPELDDDDASETESGWSSDEEVDASDDIILRRKGGQLKDRRGRQMVQVCGDEDEEENGGQDEMNELRILSGKARRFPEKAPTKGAEAASFIDSPRSRTTAGEPRTESGIDSQLGRDNRTNADGVTFDGGRRAPHIAADSETESDPGDQDVRLRTAKQTDDHPINPDRAKSISHEVIAPEPEESPKPPVRDTPKVQPVIATAAADSTPALPEAIGAFACPICSLGNEPASPTCLACSHVLKPALMKHHWRCRSETCNGSEYINAGDVGRCGLCGAQKPVVVDARPTGVLSADVLRWD